jgi:hypothetical protein
MLGGISTHREFAAAGCPDGEIYAQGVVEVTGEPDATMAIAKGIDERVREKARKGEWHPLHVAGVRFNLFPPLYMLRSYFVVLIRFFGGDAVCDGEDALGAGPAESYWRRAYGDGTFR